MLAIVLHVLVNQGILKRGKENEIKSQYKTFRKKHFRFGKKY